MSKKIVQLLPASQKGKPDGLAELNNNGLIPSTQLPSYVDDVVEGYYNDGVFYSDEELSNVITGETGKIYVDLNTNESYRYSGSTYTKISNLEEATENKSGLLSANDKIKLNRIQDGLEIAVTDGSLVISYYTESEGDNNG